MFKLRSEMFKREITSKPPIIFLNDTIKLNKRNIINFIIKPNFKSVETQNVLGFIKGKIDETIVISSHFDHLGKKDGKIYYGADDNASGTTAVLNIATAFSNAVQSEYTPYRNILFITFSGEEIGLLGSKFYTDNPVVPLSNTVVNINIDMVGRKDYIYKNDEKYIYVIGSDKLSTTLHNTNEEVNATYQNLILDYKYNQPNDPNRFYYRSDHYNFAKNNIPVIFFFNGLHDDYHKFTDTPNKIEFDLMEYRVKHFFLLAWKLANMKESISVDINKTK
jgi:Zn-dependent M28 family amino/carboxypeptidase